MSTNINRQVGHTNAPAAFSSPSRPAAATKDCSRDQDCTVALSNSAFTHNRAEGLGGGLYDGGTKEPCAPSPLFPPRPFHPTPRAEVYVPAPPAFDRPRPRGGGAQDHECQPSFPGPLLTRVALEQDHDGAHGHRAQQCRHERRQE